MTPYERHEQTGHETTRSSPNGVDIIEECTDPTCRARFLHSPSRDYPTTMRPAPERSTREGD